MKERQRIKSKATPYSYRSDTKGQCDKKMALLKSTKDTFSTDIVSDHPEQRLSLSGTPSTASSRGSNKGHLTPHPMKNFLKENRERSSSASKREREALDDASDNSQDKNKRAKANDKKANRSHVPRAANDKGAKK